VFKSGGKKRCLRAASQATYAGSIPFARGNPVRLASDTCPQSVGFRTKAGAVGFLSKPFDGTILIECIDIALKGVTSEPSSLRFRWTLGPDDRPSGLLCGAPVSAVFLRASGRISKFPLSRSIDHLGPTCGCGAAIRVPQCLQDISARPRAKPKYSSLKPI
jgi:hypothetical protein